jgi:hypothetical protein
MQTARLGVFCAICRHDIQKLFASGGIASNSMQELFAHAGIKIAMGFNCDA